MQKVSEYKVIAEPSRSPKFFPLAETVPRSGQNPRSGGKTHILHLFRRHPEKPFNRDGLATIETVEGKDGDISDLMLVSLFVYKTTIDEVICCVYRHSTSLSGKMLAQMIHLYQDTEGIELVRDTFLGMSCYCFSRNPQYPHEFLAHQKSLREKLQRSLVMSAGFLEKPWPFNEMR
ncbi:MAG TPA: hypothetical protein VHZ04_03575 [Candidatus Paceibacterota bacterium]|jgi:hypothetical protein|nr:hypothetical protein [Candidatus Paceibacterota bacterium]